MRLNASGNRVKLEHLKALDVDCQLFGTASHHYQLNPCLTDQQVELFEPEHQVSLPPEYRSFLLQGGNGGAGPDFGIPPLEGTCDNQWVQIGPLSNPFPLFETANPGEILHPEDLEEDDITPEILGKFEEVYAPFRTG